MDAYLDVHLQSAATTRIYPVAGPWGRALAWWRSLAELGYHVPLGLVADLGALLAGAEVGPECGEDGYAALLRNAAATPAVRSARSLMLSDVALVALLAHVIPFAIVDCRLQIAEHGIPMGSGVLDNAAGSRVIGIAHGLPAAPQFALPPQIRPAAAAAALAAGLRLAVASTSSATARRNPVEATALLAQPGDATALLAQPDDATALRPLILARLQALAPSDVRFVAELGQVALGLASLADLRALTELLRLPPLSHTLIDEVLAFLPALAEAEHGSAVQTYALNGYGGIARSGWLDAALPSEWALPELLLNYRYLNGELLYYGRERPPERRQTLLLLLVQMSDATAGDLEPLLKASALALARTGRARGAVVQAASFATRLQAAQTLNGPAELAALVREPCQGRVDLARVVSQVAARVRAESAYYQRIEIFWLLHAEAGRDQSAAVGALAQQLPQHLSRRALFVSAGPGVSEPALAASLAPRWASIGSNALYEPVARSQAAQALRNLMRL
ncbi:hypothetical protein [Candidatus Viridilinea mediisalina]|uniref:Uncharacterized protein n=1 Tax=Candidatus Viridilinea mediisalina TaxID=2024553 RepID=A0A2A6RIH9_9CHLR|nr:hypothetical protein [Candidatus Viridilinea mediisalina]PDW02650.1 hypothetical protein CJ255_12860 [Candidatus Viridilinea mediisalina]